MIVSISVNLRKDPSLAVVRTFLAELFRYPHVLVRLSEQLKPCFPNASQQLLFVKESELYTKCDLFLVFGGDGSIIRVAGKLAGNETPLLGVNLGRVGYLAQLEPDMPQQIRQFFEKRYQIENRMMLSCQVMRDKHLISNLPDALNDAVLSNGTVSRMVDVALRCDGHAVMTYHSDGIIVATPTGSTAYSMSAGGPILAPTMDCICITPVCPHALTSRPMVVSGDSRIEVENMSFRERNAYLSIDGCANFHLLSGDIVKIAKSRRKTAIVRIEEGGFFNTLNRKFKE